MNSSSSETITSLSSSSSSSSLDATTTDTLPFSSSPSSSLQRALQLIRSDDLSIKLEAAAEIRRLTKTSLRCRRLLAGAIDPLVSLLRVDSDDCREAALLALLNLAVKDEKNKINIVQAGALEPVIQFLHSQNSNLQEYATASLLTLSASSTNKAIITASDAIPLLVEILKCGSPQAKIDAVMALYNLSTYSNNISIILNAQPIPSLVNLLNNCRKSSKTAEKCSALIESLMEFNEGRTALMSEECGVLTVVEVLENGSLQSREHALSALLVMCQSDRCKYREPILREGVIPGLLELTVQGTPKSQAKAKTLLRLLRETPYPRSELQPDTLENIVCNIISQIDGNEHSSNAKKMLAEMVQVSMEQSLRHLQKRALVCTPAEIPITSCTSEVSSDRL